MRLTRLPLFNDRFTTVRDSLICPIARTNGAPMVGGHHTPVASTRPFVIRSQLSWLLSTMSRRQVNVRRDQRSRPQGSQAQVANGRMEDSALLIVIFGRIRRVVLSTFR